MINNVFFDWAGTLNDNTQSFFGMIDRMFERNGVPRISDEEKRREFDIPYMNFWKRYCPGMTKEEQDRIYSEELRRAPPGQLCDGAGRMLRRLREQGRYLFMLSSDYLVTIAPEMENFGIRRHFTELFTGIHDKETDFPDILRTRRIRSEQTAYLGDTRGDMRAGKIAGVMTIGVSWGVHTEDMLRQAGADHVIQHISGLEGLL